MVPFRKTAESTESHLLYGKNDLAGGGARRWERRMGGREGAS
jgi:hypothetical protein